MPSPVVKPCPKACPATCAELDKVKRLQTEAKMATEVYNPMGQRHVPGYEEVTDPGELAKLGLLRDDLEPTDSEFRAAVFRKLGTNDVVVAYKGTTMDSVSDWMANAGQGSIGYSDYYQRAKSIGRDVVAMAGKDNVKFVGHSLGGGLASAAAHATGVPASTFNAAGLHILNRSWFNAPPIDAVRVRGEILTTVQNLASPIPILAPEASGTPYPIDPPASVAKTLSRFALDKWDLLFPVRVPAKYAKAAIARSVELHGMASVNPALEAQREKLQKKADAAHCGC